MFEISYKIIQKHENCFSTLILINTIIGNLWVSILLFSLDKCKDLWRTIQSLGIIYQCLNCCKEISQKDAWTRNQSKFEFHVGHSNLTATLTTRATRATDQKWPLFIFSYLWSKLSEELTKLGKFLGIKAIVKTKVYVSILFCFVTEEIPIYSITAGSRQGSLAKPLSLLFQIPRPALSSHQHRTLVCLFWSGNLHWAHSPRNTTTTRQECFELMDVSNRSNYSFSNT